jgi:hypothetical protein
MALVSLPSWTTTERVDWVLAARLLVSESGAGGADRATPYSRRGSRSSSRATEDLLGILPEPL